MNWGEFFNTNWPGDEVNVFQKLCAEYDSEEYYYALRLAPRVTPQEIRHAIEEMLHELG